MDRIQHLILWAVLVVCCVAERQYFLQSNSSTWEQARLHCQVCYKEMVSLTPDNIQQLVQNLTSSYWIGLRKTLNNGSIPWSSWSNGDPLTFQNWHPGHPILSKPKDPVNIIFGCTCKNKRNPASTATNISTDYPFTENENMTALPTMTPAMTRGPMFFTGVTGGINGTNETETDVYIEEPCIALLSFGLWVDKRCSELLPYICYEDRFYGKAIMTNKTLHKATLSWTRGPGDISGYRVEIKSTDNNLTLNHSSLSQTYNLSNLTAGTPYRVQVFPIKCGRDLNPQNVSFYTKPGVIPTLNVTNISETDIFLFWSAPEGKCDSYYIQVRGRPDLEMTTRTESAKVKGLIPGGFYMFDVNAVVEDRSIEGDRRNISSYTKPGRVSNLRTSAPTKDCVHVQWEQPAGNTSGYRVDVWREENMLHPNITLTTYTNLTVRDQPPGTKIWLSVVALVPDNSVEGEPSTVMGLTTPGKVTDLLLVSNESAINVTWTPPEGNYETFSVQLNLTFSKEEVGKYNTNSSQFFFTGLKAGAEYTVTVTTLNECLKSDPNNITNFTLPVPPQSAKIDAFTNSSVTLSWKAPLESQGVYITYLVKYRAEFWKNTSTVIVNTTTYTFHELHAGTNYNFEVQVMAGVLKSNPVQTSQNTNATVRVQTMTMACSSSKPSFCEDSDVQDEVLKNLNNHFQKSLSKYENGNWVNNVFWELKWRET